VGGRKSLRWPANQTPRLSSYLKRDNLQAQGESVDMYALRVAAIAGGEQTLEGPQIEGRTLSEACPLWTATKAGATKKKDNLQVEGEECWQRCCLHQGLLGAADDKMAAEVQGGWGAEAERLAYACPRAGSRSSTISARVESAVPVAKCLGA